MDFVTVEGRALKHAMAALMGAVNLSLRTIPVLGCIKLSLSREGLRLEATDLDVVVITRMDVIDGHGDWSLLLPAPQLDGIARVAGPMPMRIEPGAPATILLGDGEARYTIDTLPVADFPDPVIVKGEPIERFTNGMLASLFDKVAPYISTEETRYYLNGICWHRGAHGSRFVATDGHRLGSCTYASEPQAVARSIIPYQAVALISRHLARRDVEVFASQRPDQGLVFEADGLSIATKLIDGKYPDYERVIPGPGRFAMALKRPELLAGLGRIAALERGRFWGVKFEASEGRIALSRKGMMGAARVSISSEWPKAEAEPLACFGVNASYLLSMAHDCEGDISLGLSDAGSPILVKDTDPSMTRVIMPMRV